jgi:hypothetical protein
MDETPSYFREKAKQCRRLAATVANQDARPRRDLAHRRGGAADGDGGDRPMTPDDDGLDAPRGIALGLAISAVMWVVIGVVWALLA